MKELSPIQEVESEDGGETVKFRLMAEWPIVLNGEKLAMSYRALVGAAVKTGLRYKLTSLEERVSGAKFRITKKQREALEEEVADYMRGSTRVYDPYEDNVRENWPTFPTDRTIFGDN